MHSRSDQNRGDGKESVPSRSKTSMAGKGGWKVLNRMKCFPLGGSDVGPGALRPLPGAAGTEEERSSRDC